MEMLVNTHAALKTVKGKIKQLFILQSQVNVDLLIFVLLLFSFSVVLFKLSPFTSKRWLNFVSFSCSSHFLTFFFSFFLFHTFTFFELYFWILCPGPPEINPELKNQSVTYNSPLQFKCSLSGFPTPEVLWTKDGMYLGKKNTLMIRQARFEDSGEYTCSAENLEGSMKSTFWIKVKGGTVLIHINEKEFWFIIVTSVRFFFSLLKINFHHFFSLLQKFKKKKRFSFSESDLRTFKTHKKESWFRIQKFKKTSLR